MVLIPQQPEQVMHAMRSVELGPGVQLDKQNMTAAILQKVVESVAHNEEYRKHAQDIQQVIRDAGGYQRAADMIVQFTQK